MPGLFHVVEDTQAVLKVRGVYKQVKVYRRGDKIYAAWGGGFIRLLVGGNTSSPNILWDYIETHPKIKMGSDKSRFDIAYVD